MNRNESSFAMRTRVAIVSAVLGLLLSSASAWAQGSSAASIVGVVRDSSGAVLPGVTVEAASPVLIEKVRSTVTDENGQYRIIELRPGAYSVTFTLPGFNTLLRNGIELPPNFTATINAELAVGALEETITVSGQAPLVDTQSAAQQTVISKTLLEAVPSNKSMLGFAALMPSVVTPASAQDVGGTKGETSVRISVHGGRPSDAKLLQDGMRYNSLVSSGTGRGYYANPLATQEIVIDLGAAGSAEVSTGGAQTNIIPRDGGNRLNGSGFVAWTDHHLQGNNLTDELRAQGLTSVNGTREIHDYNAMIGGPLVKDRLWFMSAQRASGRTSRVANLYHDANLDDWVFTPDLNRPVEPRETLRSHGIRFTSQVTPRHKVTFSYDWQKNWTQNLTGQLDRGTTAIEANGDYCQKNKLMQATWTFPQSDKLLFEAGATRNVFGYGANWGDDLFLSDYEACGGEPFRVLVNDTGLGLTYHGTGNRPKNYSNQTNQRASMSYASTAHHVKVGFFALASLGHRGYSERGTPDVNGLPVSYQFNNGVPTQITQYASPLLTEQALRPELGIFVQDRWTLNRMTITAGLRYEYLRAYAPAVSEPAGVLVEARSFDQLDCLPCWHDLVPRFGLVYDLFGTGRTAIKVGANKYVGAYTIDSAAQFAPVAASVNQTTRAWSDANRNFLPDCDLREPLANGECGVMANRSFGRFTPTIRPDPEWITGWGKRPYNWRYNLEVEHELLPGRVAVSAGYFRTTFGNFSVTDNLLVTPADHDPFCVQVPADPRLPSNISGQQVCGFYDVRPELFGLQDNIVTFADKYGTPSEVYNGADVNFNLRLPGGATASGGVNIGNSIQTALVAGGTTQSRTDNCFVVDSPQQLYNCRSENPYQTRTKISGAYPLPWDLQVAAVYQNLPGPNYGATATFTRAQVQSSLGRALNTSTVTIDLLAPGSAFVKDRINQLDLRLSKFVRIGAARLQANLDLYNAFNASTVLAVNNTFRVTGDNTWLQPTQILDARLLKISAQLDF